MWSSASDTLAPTVHLDSALQIIINQTPDVVFIKNKQGYITFMNATGIRLLGMSPEEIDGKSETDLFGITAGFEAWEHDFQVISSRQPKTVVAEWQIDGQIIHLQLTKQLHISPEGAILGIVGLGREVRSTGEDVWWTSPESGAHNEPNPRSGARSTATLGKAKDNSRSAASKVVLPEASAGGPSAVFGAPPVDHEIWDENRTLLSLQAATTAVTSSLDIDYLLDTLAWEMAHFLDADNCLIFDVDQNGGAATILAAYRPPPQENEQSIRFPTGGVRTVPAAVDDRSLSSPGSRLAADSGGGRQIAAGSASDLPGTINRPGRGIRAATDSHLH
jgi:PAS domain S-box-containing protein